MRQRKELTRDKITRSLAEVLKPLDYIHAFYEGGAAASNRLDEWSDIDLYLVVDDDRVDDAFLGFEKALKKLAPIKQKFDVPHTGWEGIYQAFYRLDRTSEYLFIDLAVVKLSSPDKLLEPETHGEAVFFFNKNNKVTIPRLDKELLNTKLKKRLKWLQERFDMFNCCVQKEINRGNILEAVDLYKRLTLGTLVETLRMKCNPVHYGFEMRYVHSELPPAVIKRLERLFFVKDMKDLQEKYREAIAWFRELATEITVK